MPRWRGCNLPVCCRATRLTTAPARPRECRGLHERKRWQTTFEVAALLHARQLAIGRDAHHRDRFLPLRRR